jgi:hypothetical protein
MQTLMGVYLEQEIKDIVLNNPNKGIVTLAKNHSKLLRTYIDGENLAGAIMQVDGFEPVSLKTLRTKYAISPKDLCSRLARPIDKAFSARGGSVYLNLPDADDKKVRVWSKDITAGYSIKGWIENFWKPNFLRDPNGIIFMEVASPQQAYLLQQQGKSIVYPTYKSIFSVYDYQPNGAKLDYIVFNTTSAERTSIGLDKDDVVFRFIDDAGDYYVKLDQNQPQILSKLTLPNLFMEVPAMLNSDLPNTAKPGLMLSLFDDVTELMGEYLAKGSIKITHEFLHAFPKYWQYAEDCLKCSNGELPGGGKCPDCMGSGKRLMISASDIQVLTVPETKDTPVIAPHVGGYIEPSEIFHRIATEAMQLIEDKSKHTIWGVQAAPQTQGTANNGQGQKTATQIMTDLQPQEDRLYPISDMASKRHKFIIDCAVKVQINQNYPGSSVSYGKRYMMEGPDVIFEKYINAKKSGAAVSALDDLLIEYYESKYNSDPVKLAVFTKLMKVEPFVHFDILQVKNFGCTDLDFYRKTYYGEWLSALSENEVLLMKPDALLKSLNDYAEEKLKQKPEPVTPSSSTIKAAA